MVKNNKLFDFAYPIKREYTEFVFPWDVYRGWLGWFYKKWDIKMPGDKAIWHGRIILGFKKITIEWICSPEEALKDHYEGRKRLVHYLEKLVKETNFKKVEKEHEETRLFG